MRKLVLFFLIFSSLSLFAQRGGKVSVIKKDRWIDYCLAKGNDTRVYVDETDSLNPVNVYPVFVFRQLNIESISTPSGVLDIRSSIVQEDNVLNTRTQRFNGTINTYIGDNQQRNAYPAGILELRLRLPRWQQDKLNGLNFRYSGFTGGYGNYRTSYLDASKLKSVYGIKTLDDSNSNNRLSYFNSKNNPDLKRLELPAFSQTELDISDNLDLQYLDVGTSYNNLQTLTVSNDEYSDLTFLRLVDGSLTSFPSLDAPNLTYLDLTDNPNLLSINTSLNLDLENLYVKNCGLTTLNLTNNTKLINLEVGSRVGMGNSNNILGELDLSTLTDLETFNGIRAGITSLDLSNNIKLKSLLLGYNRNNTGGNNLGSNFTGLGNLALLETLDINNNGIILNNINLDNHPSLNYFAISNNSGITGSLQSSTVNPNLQTLIINGTNITYFNPAHFPNINELTMYGTTLTQLDLTPLTKLNRLEASRINAGSMTLYDLSNVTTTISILALRENSIVTEVRLPNTQIGTMTFYSCPNLTTIVNLNSISRTNTELDVAGIDLLTLNTSFGAGNCFPNLTSLYLGSSGNTYTSTKVFDDRKNFLDRFLVLGNVFQVNGNLGTDVLNVATFMEINGDADLSFTTVGGFGTTMRRVYLRPNLTSGLATDGNQVANLIIHLSTKDWNVSGSLSIGNVGYTYGVIDLRGNCAVPTPSTALTDALDLLNTKGVTVLTN